MENRYIPRTYVYDKDEVTWKFWHKRRYVVATLAFFGFFMSYILRVNLSIAIVKMTSNYTVLDENQEPREIREFDWNSRLQGLILSSFFYGYISTQLLGGWLASRIGGKRVFGFGIAVTSFFTILTPPITRYSVYLLVAARILEGIGEGVTYPCIHAIWANWAPPLERSKLATLAFSGSFAGTVFAMPICGIMVERFGWPSVFYVFGSLGLVWYVCWSIVVRDHPSQDPHISEVELMYIKRTLGSSQQKHIVAHPWKSMVSSTAVWAIASAHFSENWGFYTMLTQLPTFMNDVFGFKLEKTGFFSGLPYLMMAVVLQVSGHLADCLRSRKICSTTQVRKIFNCGAFISQAIFMAFTAYLITPNTAIIFITIAIGLGGFAWSGFSVNYLDIAPKHASVLMGLGNTFATLPGILSPIITGYLVQEKTVDEWQIVFLMTSFVYLTGAIIYGVFASGEVQSWAVENSDHINPEICFEEITTEIIDE